MKRGKKYVEAAKAVDRATLYDTAEAISLVKKAAVAKFDETIEVHIRTGCDGRHADQQIRRIISQKSLEVSERNSTLVEIIIIFYSIIRSRTLNKKVNSPVLPFGVSEIWKVLLTLYDRKCFSIRVTAICDDFFAKP